MNNNRILSNMAKYYCIIYFLQQNHLSPFKIHWTSESLYVYLASVCCILKSNLLAIHFTWNCTHINDYIRFQVQLHIQLQELPGWHKPGMRIVGRSESQLFLLLFLSLHYKAAQYPLCPFKL